MNLLDITKLQQHLRAFSDARDWDRFHTPKNLTMALVGEAGELAAVLQWIDGAEALEEIGVGGRVRQDFMDEMADVMIYLARLADVSGVDLDAAVRSKMERNEVRFPPKPNGLPD